MIKNLWHDEIKWKVIRILVHVIVNYRYYNYNNNYYYYKYYYYYYYRRLEIHGAKTRMKGNICNCTFSSTKNANGVEALHACEGFKYRIYVFYKRT